MSLTVAKVRQRLSHIVTCSQSLDDQLKLNVRFEGVLDDIVELLDNPVGIDVIEMLEVFIETIIDENINLVISRQILTDFKSKVLTRMNNTQSKSLALFMLDKMRQRVVYFEEQMSNIRLHLSTIYEEEKNWKDAVLILIVNPFESGQKLRPVHYNLATLIRIARLYLEDNRPLEAELYINRASFLQSEDENLQMSYELTYACVLEYRNKFIEAAHKYNELSFSSKLTENKRMAALTRAIVCTILSPAGDPRCQMLTILYNDERCQTLISFSILKKLYLCHMIKPDEVGQIETMLLPHQKKKTKYNTYLLAEAMFEHNTLSISKLYKNIKIKSLASLLKVDPHKAEIIAAKMISEERIKGSIDQIDGFIHFQCNSIKMNPIDTNLG